MGDNSFDVTINYKNKDISFPAELISAGYSYKINLDVYGQIISFKPDEERNFRALMSYDDVEGIDKIDKVLIEIISRKLILLFTS